MHKSIIAGVGVAVAASLVVAAGPAAAGPAAAGPSPATPAPKTLAAIQAAGATAIADRQATLTSTLAEVGADAQITSADRATLTTTLTHDQTGLAALGTTLAADTTVTQASTDYHQIFAGYRVYALAVPQVHFAAAGDAITGTVLPALRDAQSALQTALTADPAKNTAAVQAAMTDLAARIGDIATRTDGLGGTVLAYTPADYDADHALLAGPRSQFLAAGSDISAARSDISTVLTALK